MFRCAVDKPLLSNLQRLSLSCETYFCLTDLNRLSQLEHLEINVSWPVDEVPEQNSQLRPSVLRSLIVHQANSNLRLSIDCPNLTTLVYEEAREGNQGEHQVNLLDVQHPESIKKIHTNLIGSKLARFANAEYLFTNRFEAINKATPSCRCLICRNFTTMQASEPRSITSEMKEL